MFADHGSEHPNRPHKKRRTQDPSSQSSTTLGTFVAIQPNAAVRVDNLTRHDEFWFDDGSVVLVAGNTAFRVYRALLAAQSTVFTDMFSSSSPDTQEMLDRRPVVHLSDSPKDLAHFLRVLLPKSRRTLFSRDFSFSFHQIAAVIRLAHKYHVQDVLEQAIASLKERFTDSFDAWEARTGPATIKVRSRQAIGVINLARLVDRPSLLPLAFYKCATLGSAVLDGYKREDNLKSIEHLSREDEKRCIDGRVRLAEAALTVLAEVFTARPCGGCKTHARCRTVLQAMRGDALAHEGALSASVLASWREVVSGWARERGLCGPCEKAALERDVRARRRVWDSLPKIFDIEVEGWVPPVGGDGAQEQPFWFGVHPLEEWECLQLNEWPGGFGSVS
ncbi:hypothetical protein GSI_12224 [Ganoderma sinense ZZ0214-1]|uniref:BTB domain-containing protein n=1 Tax=Ganoderma sinense ZZ0214-1 TaxID=1077348 RepID=A0A2G8RY73_9APHY|nr:hypothetical protein GSI_12224 [Ganoderma sinense ZZ0214-1]